MEGPSLQSPVTGAHMDKQPPLLSREVIKELLMPLEMLVWKRFSTRPGLGSRGGITRPALRGVIRLFLPPEGRRPLFAQSLKPAIKKQAASQGKRSSATSKPAVQIKQLRPSALAGVSSRIFWASASVLPHMEWQIFCL